MKFVKPYVFVFIVVFAVGYKAPTGFRKTFRYFKISCSSDSKTCAKPFCYIKNSRNDSTFSAGCDWIRNIAKPLASFLCSNCFINYWHYFSLSQYQITISYRSLSRYRQIIKTPKFDICALLDICVKIDNNVTFEVPEIAIFNQTFVKKFVYDTKSGYERNYNNQKIHRCPLERNFFQVYNFSSNLKHDFEKLLPNGDYRYEHKVLTEDDETIFAASIYETFKTQEESFIWIIPV